MWILPVFAAATLSVSACSSNAAAAGTAPTQIQQARKIVALGDSLTSGHGLPPDQAYPAILEGMLRAAGLPFTVISRGVAGDTTADAVRRLDAALADKPDILIVALGANDGLEG